MKKEKDYTEITNQQPVKEKLVFRKPAQQEEHHEMESSRTRVSFIESTTDAMPVRNAVQSNECLMYKPPSPGDVEESRMLSYC